MFPRSSKALFVMFWILLAYALMLVGCGGGGSQSAGVSLDDKAGIAGTLGGFLQSLRSGEPSAFMSPTLKSSESVSRGVQTLKIWDFGADINNTEDNVSHDFTIPEDGINQISGDYARAYAVKNFNGRNFRVDFELIKTEGQWFIETIKFSSDGPASSFVNAASLLPLQKGNYWRSVIVPADYSSSSLTQPMMMLGEISSDPVSKDSRQVFYVNFSPLTNTNTFDLTRYATTITSLKTTDSWPILRNAYSSSSSSPSSPVTTIRADFLELFTQPSAYNREIGYANSQGLYQYGTSAFNSGQPVMFLSASPAIGEIATKTVLVQWADGSTYPVFLSSRLARKISIQTFAGPFEAYQIDAYARFVGSVPSGQHQEMYWSRLFAVDHGEVAQIQWDSTAVARTIFLLHSASVNGRTVAALDQGTVPVVVPQLQFAVTSPLQSAVVGQPYDLVMVSGGKDPIGYQILSGNLPDSMTISERKLVGTPTTSGNYNFNIQFSDGDGATVSREFAISVMPSGSDPLAFTTSESVLPNGAVGSVYDLTLVTGSMPPYAFNLGSNPLPNGLEFSSNGVTGVPTTEGNFLFSLTVVDEFGGSINRDFSIFIGPALQFVPTSLSVATIGKPYSVPLVIGGVAPVTLSLDSGSIPPGMNFVEQKIEGNPTSAGTFTFTAKAVDASGREITRSYTIEVVDTFKWFATSPLTAATYGVPYSTLMVSGGKPPYEFILDELTPLPGDLSFTVDGYLSGTTTAPSGNYNFNLAVVDSIGNSLTSSFALPVVQPYGTAPNIKWQKVYGSLVGNSGTECAFKIFPISGGFLVIGNVAASSLNVDSGYQGGNSDVWVLKLNSVGEILWQKLIGGNGIDEAFGACQADDSNFIVTGSTSSTSGDLVSANGSSDVFVIKLDQSSGNVLWTKVFGGSGADSGRAVAFSAFPDASILVAGYTNSADGDVSNSFNLQQYANMWLLRLDSDGNKVWDRAYGGTKDDKAFSLLVTPESIYMAGYSASIDNDRATGQVPGNGVDVADAWVLKLDLSQATFGNILWQKSFGGSSSDKAYGMRIDAAKNLIVCGETSSTNVDGYTGGTDLHIFKVSDTGSDANLVWQKAYGGTSQEIGYDVEILPDGSGYIAVGNLGSSSIAGFKGNEDGWLIKFDMAGSVVWQKPYGGSHSENFQSIALSNNLLTVVGTVSSNDQDIDGLRPEPANSYNYYDWWIVQVE